MAKRTWWIVVVLAAVFAMHGLQCMDGNALGPTASSTSSHHGVGAVMVPDSGHPTTASPTTPDHPALAAALLAADPAGGHGHPTDLMGHLWSVCLAVLSVALAVRLVLLVASATRTAGPDGHPVGHGAVRSTGFRPPDIFTLCVLRT
jgi:hypothetical protein